MMTRRVENLKLEYNICFYKWSCDDGKKVKRYRFHYWAYISYDLHKPKSLLWQTELFIKIYTHIFFSMNSKQQDNNVKNVMCHF